MGKLRNKLMESSVDCTHWEITVCVAIYITGNCNEKAWWIGSFKSKDVSHFSAHLAACSHMLCSVRLLKYIKQMWCFNKSLEFVKDIHSFCQFSSFFNWNFKRTAHKIFPQNVKYTFNILLKHFSWLNCCFVEPHLVITKLLQPFTCICFFSFLRYHH